MLPYEPAEVSGTNMNAVNVYDSTSVLSEACGRWQRLWCLTGLSKETTILIIQSCLHGRLCGPGEDEPTQSRPSDGDLSTSCGCWLHAHWDWQRSNAHSSLVPKLNPSASSLPARLPLLSNPFSSSCTDSQPKRFETNTDYSSYRRCNILWLTFFRAPPPSIWRSLTLMSNDFIGT